MLLSELVENYRPVYPDNSTWEETSKFLFELEPELMEELIEECKTNKGFRNPVRLSKDPEDGDYVADGTHRVCVALHLGLKELPHTFDYVYDSDYYLETHVTQTSGEKLTEDEVDVLSLAFRSIRLNDTVWLNCDMHYGQWSFMWTEDRVELIEEINTKVLNKFKELFPNSSFTVKTDRESYDD